MKLINETLLKRCTQTDVQHQRNDPLVLARFFSPSSGATWLLTEYYPDENIAYGYVYGLCPGGDEWGYFSIAELEALKCPPFGLPIERDLHFTECRFSELKERGFA